MTMTAADFLKTVQANAALYAALSIVKIHSTSIVVVTADEHAKHAIEQMGRRAGAVVKSGIVEVKLTRFAKEATACAHEWQEQEGEPAVDICSQCGAVRS